MQPQLIAQYVNAAHAANQQGQPAKAVEFSQMALALNPGMAEAWFNLGIAQARLGQNSAAISALEQARLRCMDSAEGQNSIGLHLLELGAIETAETCLRRAIELAPNYAYAQSNLGKLFRKRNLTEEALRHVRRATELTPNEPLLHVNLAGVYIDLKRYELAEQACRNALRLEPNQAQAWTNLSVALLKQHKPDEAEAACRKALEIAPTLVEALYALGDLFVTQRKLQEARGIFEKAVTTTSHSARGWIALGGLHSLQSRHDKAEPAYRNAIKLDPDSAEAWARLGLTLKELKRHEDAINSLQTAYALDPKLDYLLCWKLMAQASVCDWREWVPQTHLLLSDIKQSAAYADPLSLIALHDDPEAHCTAARSYAHREHPTKTRKTQHSGSGGERIRVGYFSADFREHPVAQLLVELLELRDSTRFEVFGFSLSPSSDCKLGLRIAKAFDRFIDVSQMDDATLVKFAHEQNLDIAVNLSGYTAGSRNNVFAERIAPVQVSYLGYPGTTGAVYMDYLITDPVVCPQGTENWYTEKLARLPSCFMPHDSLQSISERTPSRSEFDLPENSFVFCCFNNHYKLNPEVFDIWMRLLRQVEGSVLWLTDGPELMKKNLRREAALRDVEPGRLVFAKRVQEMADHLARYRLADLFLDTLPYNAHTTACDALWAGVPVLTRPGKSFASRVAASLLHAAGLPELITNSPEAYEALALTLARDPSRLESVRQKLHGRRIAGELFNTKKLTRDIESLFVLMHQRRTDGLPTDHITANTTA